MMDMIKMEFIVVKEFFVEIILVNILLGEKALIWQLQKKNLQKLQKLCAFIKMNACRPINN